MDILANLAGIVLRVADRATLAAIDLAAAADVIITDAANDSPASSNLTRRSLADKFIIAMEANNDYSLSTIQKYTGSMRPLCAILGDAVDPEKVSFSRYQGLPGPNV